VRVHPVERAGRPEPRERRVRRGQHRQPVASAAAAAIHLRGHLRVLEQPDERVVLAGGHVEDLGQVERPAGAGLGASFNWPRSLPRWWRRLRRLLVGLLLAEQETTLFLQSRFRNQDNLFATFLFLVVYGSMQSSQSSFRCIRRVYWPASCRLPITP
jgi:hypothetical protein